MTPPIFSHLPESWLEVSHAAREFFVAMHAFFVRNVPQGLVLKVPNL